MSDAIAERLAVAEAVVGEAAALALDFFQNRDTLVIEDKASPQDIVSRADREVEELIRARISAVYPDDGFLGEEGGTQGGTSGFTWVIDPIDGTTPFLNGLPHWCVVLALVKDGETVAGVIEQPLMQERFTARAGQGAFLNGVRLKPRPEMVVANSVIAIGASHRTPPDHCAAVIRELMTAGGLFYRNGSGAIMLASVAAGRLGGYYEPHMNAWDCLAALLMIREAGGRVAPFPGDGSGGMVIAAQPQVWDGLQAVLAAAG